MIRQVEYGLVGGWDSLTLDDYLDLVAEVEKLVGEEHTLGGAWVKPLTLVIGPVTPNGRPWGIHGVFQPAEA